MFTCKLENLTKTNLFNQDDLVAIAEFLKQNDLKTIPVGNYPLNKDNVVKIFEYETKEPNDKFEGHEKFADVQCIIFGEEKLSVANVADCSLSQAYNEVKDVYFYNGPASDSVVLKGGSDLDCVVFMPFELHQPNVCAQKPSQVKKMVIKIRIND
jgi:YhcH/YjgK/YiaL family protein